MRNLLEGSASGFDYLDSYSTTESQTSDNVCPEAALASGWPAQRLEVTFEISAETASSAWFQRALTDLKELLQMDVNWNGYGERIIHVASAKRLVHILDRMGYRGLPVSIVPLSSGGLQIEWHKGPASVEVEVPPTGEARGWFFDDDSDEEIEWVVSSAQGLRQMQSLLERVASA